MIGASMSEPYTSELNGGISLMYVYIMYYTSYVHCTHTRATTYVCDLIGNTCTRFCEHVYSEYFQKSSEPSQDKETGYCAHEIERTWRVAETAKQRQERLTKQLGTLPRLQINLSCCTLCIYTLQTCTMYITTMLPINTRYNSLTLTPQCTAFA